MKQEHSHASVLPMVDRNDSLLNCWISNWSGNASGAEETKAAAVLNSSHSKPDWSAAHALAGQNAVPSPIRQIFVETAHTKAGPDLVFYSGLYAEAIRAMLAGDLPTARLLLRDVINATTGAAAVAKRIGVHEKSVVRVVAGGGAPHAAKLLAIAAALKDLSGLSLMVQVGRGAGETLR